MQENRPRIFCRQLDLRTIPIMSAVCITIYRILLRVNRLFINTEKSIYSAIDGISMAYLPATKEIRS